MIDEIDELDNFGPSLEVQKFLLSGNSIEDLEKKYAIKARRHKHYNNLVLFKYNQLESPFQEKIVRECRGIILDENQGWTIVSRAFEKFFNLGEELAAEIDWSSARVQEKLDGSIIVLYQYDNKWNVATSGSPDASGDVGSLSDLNFETYFWETYRKYQPEYINEHISPLGPNKICFFFELMGPMNRIVVQHSESKLTLLGWGLFSGPEFPIASMPENLFPNIPRVKEFSLNSYDDIIKSFQTMSPLQQEGYVVVDKYFNRVKIKHPGYVLLHHAKSGMTKKAFVDIIRTGENSEVIAAFPEFKPQLDKIKIRYDLLVEKIENDYNRLCHIENQKEFAIEAVKTKCSSALFAVRSKRKESVRDFFKTIRIENLIELLDI